MKPDRVVRRPRKPRAAGVGVAQIFGDNVVRLIKRAPERRALDAGEVDAIMDPVTGRAVLLPAAQAALIERKARFRSLVELASDGYWEQDTSYRFILQTGVAIGNEQADEGILGKTLWELSFGNGGEIDWQTHRTQLEWRAVFRNLEFDCLDRAGLLRRISISGEPTFDAAGEFAGYRGITRDVTHHELANRAALGSEGLARATLDALATQVCVLDTQGAILSANSAWRAFAAMNGSHGHAIAEGDNYLAACAGAVGDERVDAVAMADGIRQVIAGEREVFHYERVYGVPPVATWVMATVTRLGGAGAARASVAYHDISALKQAARLQRLECTVARVLAVADDAAVGVQGVISAVCATQDWDCGRFFRLDPAAGVLVAAESWAVPEGVVEEFLEKSGGSVVRADAGLVGRVSESGEPLWLPSALGTVDTPPTALAHETGLAGAFYSPVTVAGQPIGVLAFNGRRVQEPDERLLAAARSVGEQLGRFVQRQQAQDALRRSEERFRRLTELAADWYWEQDVQFRYTRVVGDGIVRTEDMLGRTLWELPGIILSNEQKIAHSSEVAAQWSFCDFDCAVALPDGQLAYFRLSGEPLYDAAGAFSGFHGTGLDVTERKRAQIALQQPAAR